MKTSSLYTAFGHLRFYHPAPTFAPTAASRIAVQAIAAYRHLLAGTGIDWGCGVGVLAITAARIKNVQRVLGLDIEPANIEAAIANAYLNGVAASVDFWLADSFQPQDASAAAALEAQAGRIQFILANPPASEGDDGFGFRRRVLREGRRFLTPGGLIFLNISAQYGRERIERLPIEAPGFAYEGLLSSSDWMAFDMARPDLLRCLEQYAATERQGEPAYAFRHPQTPEVTLDARQALALFRQRGLSPLSRWQVHLFRYVGAKRG